MSKLRLLLLGTGSPRPQAERAGPAYLVQVGHQHYQVDCGDGAVTRLLQAGISPARVKQLLFTHLHTDHTLGYGQFVLGGWALGRRQLLVLGPPGTVQLHNLLFEEAYRTDLAYRLSTGRESKGLMDVQVKDIGPGIVLEENGVRVTAARMAHEIPTLAYRFDYRGHSVVLSGDTAPCDALVDLADRSDVLVVDCCLDPVSRELSLESAEEHAIWERISREHCTPEQAGGIAARARVRKLVLTHFLPAARSKPTVAEARRAFAGEIVFGRDLLEVIAS